MTARWEKMTQRKHNASVAAINPAWAEVDLAAIRHNFRSLSKAAGRGVRLLCVVKADAYGHGMLETSHALSREGTDFFGVADLGEGVLLRRSGIKKPVLVFANTLPSFAGELIRFNLTTTVCTFELAVALDRAARKTGKRAKVHIKIDTGMGRLGVWHEEALEFIAAVYQLKNIFIEGIYTHFAAADTDEKFTQKQIWDFLLLNRKLKACGINIPLVHAANSAGLVDCKVKDFNLARAGLMLYGMYPHPRFKAKISLKPALSVKSRMMFVKKIEKGRSISYGRTFVAKRPMAVATIPIGYNDGYFRILSNKSSVLVGRVSCPVIGRVTMDQIVTDVSRVKSPRIGMEVVLLGRQGTREISADTLAALAGTINYEVTCSLGNSLPRFYRF